MQSPSIPHFKLAVRVEVKDCLEFGTPCFTTVHKAHSATTHLGMGIYKVTFPPFLPFTKRVLCGFAENVHRMKALVIASCLKKKIFFLHKQQLWTNLTRPFACHPSLEAFTHISPLPPRKSQKPRPWEWTIQLIP